MILLSKQFVQHRSLAYRSGDEWSIRFLLRNNDLSPDAVSVAELDQHLFWCHIYTAILSIHLNFPSPAPESQLECLRIYRLLDVNEVFPWYMIVQRAKEYFKTHVTVKVEWHRARFHYLGFIYYLPRELYDV